MRKLFALIFIAASSAHAANVFIRPGGTCAGPDSACSDWSAAKSYPTLPSTLVRGNVYYMADGNYDIRNYDNEGDGTKDLRRFNVANSGTQWITVKKAVNQSRCPQGKTTQECRGTETGWADSMGAGQAVLNGWLWFSNDYYEIDGQVRNESNWQDTASYGFRISAVNNDTTNGPSANFLRFKYVDVGADSNITDYSRMTDGFKMTYSQHDIYIGYTHIHNVTEAFQANGTSKAVIEYNHIGPSWGKEAIIGTGNMDDWIIRFNKFVDNGFYAGPTTSLTAEIAVWSGGSNVFDRWEIYGNLFWNTAAGQSIAHNNAIIKGGDSDENLDLGAANWKVYNNVFAGMNGYQASVFITKPRDQIETNEVFNNIWYDIGASAITCRGSCSNNWCFRKRDAGVGYGACSNLSGTRILGMDDPFINYAAGNFQLDPNITGPSPINTGRAPFPIYTGDVPGNGYHNRDAAGAIRGQGAGWDIGMFEVSDGGPPQITHPADTNSDYLMSLNEATKYGACWKNSAAFGDCPSGIAIDYAVRAGTLWAGSATGQYQYNSANACPLCWEIKP